ncbi:MAG: 50S ribosomal protein L5 [Candidatus Thermoplasmatota archaeon]|jgi:large subunit ribosomal protein L5|nr:50S ribosomal protein L5 [Candidatus Thermoplasmatota archaeon]MDP7264518.1 50S ribosomal protein L5 [Candidatus Thermoplasmatota archaeon]
MTGDLDNPMRTLSIDKVVVNIGVGEAGEKLIRAEKVIDLLTGRKSVRTISRTTNRDFGIRKMMPIGCKVTLRKGEAEDFLKRAFWIKQNKIASYSFDLCGNFSFGISDFTDFQGMKYDPEVGIFGMDVCVSLKRNGYRISRRKMRCRKLSSKQRISKDEAYDFLRREFDVEVVKLD